MSPGYPLEPPSLRVPSVFGLFTGLVQQVFETELLQWFLGHQLPVHGCEMLIHGAQVSITKLNTGVS